MQQKEQFLGERLDEDSECNAFLNTGGVRGYEGAYAGRPAQVLT
jgi:hypothetical protein